MLLVVLDKYSLFWPTVDVNGHLPDPTFPLWSQW